MEPTWIKYAKTLIGIREIPGPQHNSIILNWIQKLNGWFTDDETPWCGTFVGHVMQTAGFAVPKHWYRARDWLNWGVSTDINYGAVCVLSRGSGGHVFFVTKYNDNYVWGIGGNQGDMVNESKFARSRVLGYRWPIGGPTPKAAPFARNDGTAVSTNEA